MFSNDFRPVMIGRVRPCGSGSQVEFRMRPPLGVLLFAGLWVSALVVALGAAMIAVRRGQSPPWAPVTILIYLGCMFFAFAAGGFVADIERSQQALREALRKPVAAATIEPQPVAAWKRGVGRAFFAFFCSTWIEAAVCFAYFRLS